MDAEERRREILDSGSPCRRRRRGQARRRLGVSEETVRRDLRVLEQHGLVGAPRGGAYPVESAGFETTLAFRTMQYAGEVSGSRAHLLGDADGLHRRDHPAARSRGGPCPRDRPLTVITASLTTATGLAARDNTTVLLLGGRSGHRGPLATHMLSGFSLAFISTNGISRQYGLTTRIQQRGQGGGAGVPTEHLQDSQIRSPSASGSQMSRTSKRS
ncbi:Transcriptional regulator OS=Streptomyces antimycoticus OX=68175 GN=SANT12839_084260 PE=4 SV=1 [Streptomyces antimycoticus]